MKKLGLPKSRILKKNSEIRRVISHNCCINKGLVRIFTAPNDCGHPRLGVSVSKRCGPAVVRNRIKRVSREVFRLEQHNIDNDLDYLLIFSYKSPKNKKNANSLLYSRLSFQQLRKIFQRLPNYNKPGS